MSKSIIKETVKREVSTYNWGSSTRLIEEANYFIDEYTVNSGQTIAIEQKFDNLYFIIASGTAEFISNNKTEKYFKGDKVSFKDSAFAIKNCGIIPVKE